MYNVGRLREWLIGEGIDGGSARLKRDNDQGVVCVCGRGGCGAGFACGRLRLQRPLSSFTLILCLKAHMTKCDIFSSFSPPIAMT